MGRPGCCDDVETLGIRASLARQWRDSVGATPTDKSHHVLESRVGVPTENSVCVVTTDVTDNDG
jgi:hypothetical protein